MPWNKPALSFASKLERARSDKFMSRSIAWKEKRQQQEDSQEIMKENWSWTWSPTTWMLSIIYTELLEHMKRTSAHKKVFPIRLSFMYFFLSFYRICWVLPYSLKCLFFLLPIVYFNFKTHSEFYLNFSYTITV